MLTPKTVPLDSTSSSPVSTSTFQIISTAHSSPISPYDTPKLNLCYTSPIISPTSPTFTPQLPTPSISSSTMPSLKLSTSIDTYTSSISAPISTITDSLNSFLLTQSMTTLSSLHIIDDNKEDIIPVKTQLHTYKSSKLFTIMDTAIDTLIEPQKNTLYSHDYKCGEIIASTLQGHIISAVNTKTHKTVMIKTINKSLYNKGITFENNVCYDDIVKEAKFMKQFMQSKTRPSSMIKYYDFFEDCNNYYLVMEKGGFDFFDFVAKIHELLDDNKLSVITWRKKCKYMFAQMVKFINWMHNDQRCVNLDISLENLLISGGKNINSHVMLSKIDDKTALKLLDKCKIKFIDFGCTEYFNANTNPKFICNKFSSFKRKYQSPQVHNKNDCFCADKADVFALGITLFMMIIGQAPFISQTKDDYGFECIITGHITQLIGKLNKLKYVTRNLLDLLTKMLCEDEEERFNIEQVMNHPWLNSYFKKEKMIQRDTV